MNPDDLPDEIVQPLMDFGRALLAQARAQRDHSLAEHEEGVLAAWRRVSPGLLEAVLQVATTGLEDNARPIAARCPRCQQRRGVQSQRTRQVQTRLGPIRLKRWWHHCWACGRGWSPPDRALGVGAVSADQYGTGALARGAGRGDHVFDYAIRLAGPRICTVVCGDTTFTDSGSSASNGRRSCLTTFSIERN